MRLSPHFSLWEFTQSQTATRMGAIIVADEAVVANLRRLCSHVLEPVREAFGAVRVSSGYRPPWLNDRIGGAPQSQHCSGLAADIIVPSATPFRVAQAIENASLSFDQCMQEFGRWVHVSIAKAKKTPRRQILTAIKENKRTVYLQGLHGEEVA